MDIPFKEGICIGSLYNSTSFEVFHASLRLVCSGTRMTILGTLDGDKANIYLHELLAKMSIRAEQSIAVGSMRGATDFRMHSGALKYKGVGERSLIYGGFNENSKIELYSVDSSIDISNNDGRITAALPENITDKQGISYVTINGEEVDL